MHIVQALGDILAAAPTPTPSPSPGPAVAPAQPVQVKVGQYGEWFGPIVILVASITLDWSALGSNAVRDRIAALGYYAATVSIIAIYEWEDDIQGWFGGSASWKLTGSAIAFILHLLLLLAVIGTRFKKTAALTKKVHDLIHLDHKDSSANRINTTLATSAALAGMSSVLARGPLAGFTHFVGTAITGLWAWIANALVNGLGG